MEKDIQLLITEATQIVKECKHLRLGQSMFNILCDMDWPLAEEIRGSDVDPFHSDEKIEAFLDYVKNKWEGV